MLTIFLVHLLGLLSPGPDFFYVSRKAASSSTRNALGAALGITFGIAIWVLVALFGLKFLTQNAFIVQYWVIILGGSYLAYSGIKMINIRQNNSLDESKEIPKSTLFYQEVLSGLKINLANPKVVIFFSSVLSAYTASYSSFYDLFTIFLMLCITGLLYFILIALLFSHQTVRQFYKKYYRYIDNLAGFVFLFFGLKLIYSGITLLFF